MSTNDFFQRDYDELYRDRQQLSKLLKIRCFSLNYISAILEAYDFFVINKNDFDGATLLQDLYDYKNLDLKALVHDYIYLKFNCASSYTYKKKADNLFAKMHSHFHNGDLERITRRTGLGISTTPFLIFNILKKGVMKKEQKNTMDLYLIKFN